MGFQPVTYYQLPAGHTGENAQLSDFVELEEQPRLDELLPHNGSKGSNRSLNLRVEQEITEDLSVYASLRWVNSDSSREGRRLPLPRFQIPASNAYNPFGVPVEVGYVPDYEFENGLLPAPHEWSKDKSPGNSIGNRMVGFRSA